MTARRETSYSSLGLARTLLCLFSFLSCSVALPQNGYGDSTCTALSTVLPGKVFFPGTPSYTSSAHSYFFRECRQNPNCIVTPSSAEEVSQAIAILTARPSTKFAIRGGGHSPNKGASNTDDGVTIDLSSMKSIEPQDGNWEVIEIGPGTTAMNLYQVLDVYNRTVLGGRVGSVGMAGFLTGGMYSDFHFPYFPLKLC